MHEESYFVRYFVVPSRVQKEDSVDVVVCLSILAEYQRIFVSTYNNPLLMKGIDYCWPSVLFKARLCDIKSNFALEFENHASFTTHNRIMNARIPLQPLNALYIGLKRAMKTPQLMSILKNCWGAPPNNFETAISIGKHSIIGISQNSVIGLRMVNLMEQ